LIKVGIDTGGTFSDFVVADGGGIRVHKVLSTPKNPALAVIQGLKEVGILGKEKELTYGSTVAANALLERKGGRVAFVTTQGFEDMLEIGRQARPDIYDLYVSKPPPIVPAEMCYGVKERVNAQGQVETGLTDVAFPDAFKTADSFAVCLLHSYLSDANERELGLLLQEHYPGKPVTLSCDILPEYREYERASTTIVNAYVAPLMAQHLSDIEGQMGPGRFRVMQSNGGSISASTARFEPIKTVLSGPAGGVVGAFAFASSCGFENVITLDMGGTSTDVSLCPGRVLFRNQTAIDSVPIKAPIIDIHTVGAGGGSIAALDPAGGLAVGPQSAGADPGPICYNRGGTKVTITDANLYLGRLDPDHFLGGNMRLKRQLVQEEIGCLSLNLGLKSMATAEGIIKIANTKMQRAIMAISVERGHDPRDFVLLTFGGAGGLHCCALADELGIPKVLVPRDPGALSAYGMLLSDVVKNYSANVMGQKIGPPGLSRILERLRSRGVVDLEDEGFGLDQQRFFPTVDIRYTHQSFELEVPFNEEYEAAFHRAHEARYGYSMPGAQTEAVTARLKAVGITDKPLFKPLPQGGKDASGAIVKESEAVFDLKLIRTPIYDRSRLMPGNEITGPAIVVEYSATTVIDPGHRAEINRLGGIEIWRA